MTILQQNSLITYVSSHSAKCDCQDCKYFGGVEELFKTFDPQSFINAKLARIYTWLQRQFIKNGTCDLPSLNYEDPTAPKLSDISQCHTDSFTEGDYIPLRKLIII